MEVSSNYDGERKHFAEGFTYEIKGSPSSVRVRDVELVLALSML